MVNKWLRKFGLGMSAVMTVSQLSGMVAMAAPEDDFGDRLEEQFDAEAEDIEDDAETTLLDVEEEDIDSVEITTEELVPPIDVKWEAPGVYSFVVNSTQEMFYGSEVYYNGERWGSATFGSYISKEGIGYKEVDHYESCFSESGTYTVKIYVAATDSQDAPKVYAAEIPEISWTCPDNKISAPTNLHWEKKDDEHFAVITCDPVEHAYQYIFSLYNSQGYVSGAFTRNNYFDFSDKIGDMSNSDYYVTSRAYSDDLTAYANSDLSEKSPSLTINGGMVTTQKDIVDISRDVNASNIDEKIQQVKNIDNSTLKSSLQTSNEALQAMGKIEDEYKNAKGIEILPAISDVEKIAANKIEMTGAALNVSEGTVQLNVKDQKEAGSSIINTDIYTNIIAFDMIVNSSEGVDFSKELEVPVTISMPIPEGMDVARLVILHYRADGTEELINPRIENSKAVFAITHFSTFALAEKKAGGEEKGAVLKKEDGNFICYVDGIRDDSYIGYADYDGSKFYVENGSIKTTLNGVMIDPNSDPLVWYFCSNGQVQTQHVGLAEYDSEWFYIENGKVATDMNAFVKYDGGLFAVGAGRIIGEYNGLMQDPQNPQTGDWYFFANGQAQTQYTGLAMYDGKWFYVVKGKLAVDYTGTVDYDGATFNVVGGMVQEGAGSATAPTTDPVITPEPKVDPKQTTDNETTGDWKQAYLNYINNYNNINTGNKYYKIYNENKYYWYGYFIYLDSDDTPELVLEYTPSWPIAYTVLSYHNGKIQDYSLAVEDGDTGDMYLYYIERNGVFRIVETLTIDVEEDVSVSNTYYIMLSGDGFHDYSMDADKFQSKAIDLYETPCMPYDDMISYLK